MIMRPRFAAGRSPIAAEPAAPEPDADPQAPPSPPRRCPHCETGHLTLLRRLSPARPQGP